MSGISEQSSRPTLRAFAVGISGVALVLVATSWHASASPRRETASTPAATSAELSHVYVGRFNASTDIHLSTANHTIVSTPKLPAGIYLVNATTSLAMYSQNGTQCHVATALGNTTGNGQGEETQTPTGLSGFNANLSIVDTVTKVTANDEIELVCHDYAEGSTPSEVNSALLTATPVHTLSTHY